MAVLLAASAPVPTGALGAWRLVDDATPGTPLNLDVDDLTVDVTVAGDPGTFRLDDDDLGFAVYPPAGLAAGTYAYALAVDSTELAVAATTVAVGEVTGHLYGASVAGVEALVTSLTLTYQSNPSIGDVDRWLDELGARVAGRIVGIANLPADVRTAFEARAAGIVHLGAAAYTSDAAHPERATVQGDTNYGAVLWARFLEALEELAADVERAVDDNDVDPAGGGQRAAASFPPPLFHRSADYS